MTDTAHRFLFEHCAARGEIVQLRHCYREVLDTGTYTAPVAALLGEFMAASALLGATIKFSGSLTLQARSNAQVPLIMAEYSNTASDGARTLRAIARRAEEANADDFASLLGGGNLALTVQPRTGQRYQGIVSLAGDSLASAVNWYFAQSEQLPTWLMLAADGRRAAGLLLQAMPAARDRDDALPAADWEHLLHLGTSLKREEILQLPAAEVLYRLFHQQEVRLLPGNALRFHCSCSAERVARALALLGRREVEQILFEQGRIEVHCEFCNTEYTLGPADIARIFGDPPRPRTH